MDCQTGALKYEIQYQENKMAHVATVSSAIREQNAHENLFPENIVFIMHFKSRLGIV